jgi:ribonuclease BN (tRNA processing enzyme)
MRLLLFFFCASACAQDARVVLLGTGTPNPDPRRMGPAVAVLAGNNAYIVDCGPGVVRRAAEAGIEMRQLTRAFVTHLHSDHTAGLPDLIFTPAVTGRASAFRIFGPPGLRAMVGHLMEAWKEDIDVRLHGGEPAIAAAYEVTAADARPGEVYRDGAVRVLAFEVNHGAWKHSYGYRFETPGKVIVISGDTTYSPRLVEAAKGCDILVHEVYSARGLARRTPDWQRYHSAFHTSGTDVGRVAAQVRPRKLVLYHQLPFGETDDEVLGEVRAQFPGEIVYGRDLDVIR